MSSIDQVPKSLLPKLDDFRTKLPALQGSVDYCPKAWFLGPKAENTELFMTLITKAINGHLQSRMNFHKEDSPIFEDSYKKDPVYIKASKDMAHKVEQVINFLKHSLPYSSFRYQGHMTSDVTIASVVGTMATVLYNPNNVTVQASPVTTFIEMAVSNDLARMVGWEFPETMPKFSNRHDKKAFEDENIIPCFHLTCGGTVSNIEGFWASYWTKFIPLALKAAIAKEADLAAAKDVTVKIANGTVKKLSEVTSWEGCNIKTDDNVKLPYDVAELCNIDPQKVTFLLKKYHPSVIGNRKFFTDNNLKDPLMFASGAAHYSIPKAAALLGLGSGALISVQVDAHARIDMVDLKKRLEDCAANQIPVIHCVAVNGTTEESAVDDFDGMVLLRNEMSKKGLSYNLVADCAWGGYFSSIIKDDYEIENPKNDILYPTRTTQPPQSYSNDLNEADSELFASKYFAKQLKALKHFDTITIDPHKAGYVHYESASIGYRNKRFRDILVYTATYIGGSSVPSVGIYGIQGSKAGSTAVSVYLSHSIMRTSKSGYGMVLKRCLLSTRLFYLRLLWLCSGSDQFKVVGVPIEPSQATLDGLKSRLYDASGVMKSVDTICQDDQLVKDLAEVGPDQNIVCFGINFKDANGNWNNDYNKYVDLNNKVYERFDFIKEVGMTEFDLIFSNTAFNDQYGQVFQKDLSKRFGLTTNIPAFGTNTYQLPVLRSTVMDVFTNETTTGSFFDVSMPLFKSEVAKIVTTFVNSTKAAKPSH
ncbi:hypothetical protein RB653_006747 [Dictyostelium firmibasis]|uniref:Uncharacterized protein n=1 Tax=Dictyostelium firmibasis TaxID=79012 RepID=A0AAN7YLG5_9MYCE